MKRVAETEAMLRLEDARRFNQIMGKGMVQHEYRKLADTLARLGLPDRARILDVGTGTGYLALAVADRLTSARVVGLDLSTAMLDIAKENTHNRHLEERLEWKSGHAGAVPFEKGEFDGVISSGSLHHWEDPVRVFDEVARVLKPGGRVIIRDSKRLSGWGLSRVMATLIGITLPADFRVHYWGSIRSSYTVPELQSLVERSRLRGSRITEDLLDMMVVK